jgi:hypothetical protein
MAVGAVGSSNTAALSAVLQQKAAQQEVQANERENDGDKDDGAKAVTQPSPTVNTQGQQVGTLINTTA